MKVQMIVDLEDVGEHDFHYVNRHAEMVRDVLQLLFTGGFRLVEVTLKEEK